MKLERENSIRDPYKVIVWGPGNMGQIAIYEIIQSPAFELVGVYCYSATKKGKDAGELIGLEKTGVTISNDANAVMAIDCDVIVYTAHDDGNFQTDGELVNLLAAGKNVVTPLPYQNLDLWREPDFVEKVEVACRQGKSVLHGSGIDPDLFSDRLMLALTGGCADIQSIRLLEIWDSTSAPEFAAREAGFGMMPEEADKIMQTKRIAINFFTAVSRTVEKVLNIKYDRIETSHEFLPTPKDITEPYLIEKGQVAHLLHRMECYVDAVGSQPFFTIEGHWCFGNDMLPEGVQPGQYYIAEIEGRPSLRLALDVKTSLDGKERFYHVGNMVVDPIYLATIVPCLQAIPHICAAEPGILPSFGPTLNWMPDLRASVF